MKRRRTVVGCVLLSSDHGFRVEKRPVRTSLDVVDGAGLEINVEGAGDMFS